MSLAKLWQHVTAAIERAALQTTDIRREPFSAQALEAMATSRSGLIVVVSPPSATKTINATDSTLNTVTMSVVIVQRCEDVTTALESAERAADAILASRPIAGYCLTSLEIMSVEVPEDYAASGAAVFGLAINFTKHQTI